MFFAWKDSDGDNVWDSGEDRLPGFENGPKRGDIVLDNQSYYLGQILNGETKYIGIAWCFGTMDPVTLACDGKGDQNEAQTDAISATVGFYVEQTRHNVTFNCPSIAP